ncbi:hypothetical protein [Saccharicrinis fermentans]|uniref:Universal stress protein family protein n=1 Tax=Saccharicrinis fermentans DSM 9555 = JCM 21142 TaxID=869213 RepID=W7YLF9_9BACT|nr:hypothetical protein [Saccharicrinis fermentans]GAF03214.1 hypothetical protein JCM21142_41879 [Saccharicrinis fermentans DSM 9555 = JCM 21142]
MPLKRIIVPVNLSREPKFILEYASNLALVSNAKLSCICHGGEESGKSIRHRSEAIKKDGHLMLSYVRTINEILVGKKIAYEVIITSNGISKSLKNYTTMSTPYLLVIELSDIDLIYPLIVHLNAPSVLFHR